MREIRLQKLAGMPTTTEFLVTKEKGLYWKKGDRGYTTDVREAKTFSHADITEKVHTNHFMDKEIIILDKSGEQTDTI